MIEIGGHHWHFLDHRPRNVKDVLGNVYIRNGKRYVVMQSLVPFGVAITELRSVFPSVVGFSGIGAQYWDSGYTQFLQGAWGIELSDADLVKLELMR